MPVTFTQMVLCAVCGTEVQQRITAPTPPGPPPNPGQPPPDFEKSIMVYTGPTCTHLRGKEAAA